MSLSIQKANFWKRISAFLFDFIMTAMLATGLAALLSLALGFDKTHQEALVYYEENKTKIEEMHPGVDLDITEEDFNKLTEEQKTEHKAADEAFSKALSEDERYVKVSQYRLFLILVILSISVLLSILLVEFVVPLFLHNGQTLGKKIFGIALVRSNCVKVSTFVLFVRTIFGKYTIETMFPIALLVLVAFQLLGIVGIITIGLLFVLQIGVLIATKYNSSIHDLLSDTIVVDFASQRIFDTQEDMLAFVQAEQAEEAAKPELA